MIKRAAGFSLIEMLVAFAIASGIALLIYHAVSGAIKIENRVNDVTQHTNQLNRVWQRFNDDIHHVVARPWVDYLDNSQVTMIGLLGEEFSVKDATLDIEQNYVLRFVRRGNNHVLSATKSDMQVVGYRIAASENEDDNTISLWRDQWQPVDSAIKPIVHRRLLLEGIESIRLRYLPSDSQRVDEAAWVSGWPTSTQKNDLLPIAIAITIELETMGDIMRLFSLTQTDN
jgi:general secretion pathway protein J